MKRKIFFCILFVLCGQLAFSQQRAVQNQLLSDTRLIHFGFSLGMNFMDFGITHSNSVDEAGNSYYMAVPNYKAGFSVGIISDLKLLEFLNVRFVPMLNFGDRSVVFVDQHQNPAPKSQVIKSTLLNFPVYVKYRANRRGNYRPYLIAGSGIMIDLSREKENLLLLKGADVSVEFGIGCDFYMPYFKLAPELKFCIGLLDVLERERPDLLITSDMKYTNALSKLTTRMFVLTFNFE